MIGFPKMLHPLHLFEEDGVAYAADLEKARVVELSAVMTDILKLAETETDDTIIKTLSASYPEDEISEAFARCSELEKAGVLFNRGEDLRYSFKTESKWRKLLIVIPGIDVDSFFDTETVSAGTKHGTLLYDSVPHRIHRPPFRGFSESEDPGRRVRG